jgi:sugar O-acyltransferase (sialic acid O-acetyltransferase NeuD family)
VTGSIAIYGGGGSGREVLQLIRDINARRPTWDCLGFIIDPEFVAAPSVHGLPVLGGAEWLARNADVRAVIAIGAPADRRRIANRVSGRGATTFATLVHPDARVGDHVVLGPGTIVCAGALLTTDITVGTHVHVNIGASISHDAVLEDYATLGPGARLAGHVTVREGAELGLGAVVIPRCEVGAWAIVGAGSVVTAPVPGNATVVGSPARVIKERPPGWHDG